MSDRIWRVAKKELVQLRRDRKFLRMVIFAPIVQMIVFGYVATLDVKEIPIAVYDQCRSVESREIVDKLTSNGYFLLKGYIFYNEQIDKLLDRDIADAVIVIPPDFSKNLKRGKTAHIQMLVNGVNSNSASIAANYATNIIMNYSEKILVGKIKNAGSSGFAQLVSSRDRVWFNPELKSVYYMVPGIIALVLMIMLVPLTAMSIVREKETGTIEQLNITPLTPIELIIGKTVPFIIIGFADIAVVTAVGMLLFDIPLRGSIILLYCLSIIFIIGSLMLGILISTFSDNMTQAFMGSMFVLLPNMMLSGFIFPISSMPQVIQWLTYLIPMRYFLVIIRSIFLKGSGLFDLLPETAGLIVFSLIVLVLSSIFIVKKNKAV
jgi:ABC-2 type transport system permease protein